SVWRRARRLVGSPRAGFLRSPPASPNRPAGEPGRGRPGGTEQGSPRHSPSSPLLLLTHALTSVIVPSRPLAAAPHSLLESPLPSYPLPLARESFRAALPPLFPRFDRPGPRGPRSPRPAHPRESREVLHRLRRPRLLAVGLRAALRQPHLHGRR